MFKLKETMVYKPRRINDVTRVAYTGSASAIPRVALENSPALRDLVWRVSYFPDSNEFGPRKPFWFLKCDICLENEGDTARIV